MKEEFWLGSKHWESSAASGMKHYFNIMKSTEPKGTCGVLVKANINKFRGLLCFSADCRLHFFWIRFSQEAAAFQWTYEALSPGCYYTCFLCGTATPLPFPQ